ncbi:MAG: ABC transporter permease [Planctomycetota bacterium]
MSEKKSETRKPPETFGAIVARQYKKNVPAVIALWSLLIIFLFATYAPVLAHDVPFWTDLEGIEGSPWFRSLIDPNVFGQAVDIFFNLLMFTFPILALATWLTHGKVRKVIVVLWLIGQVSGFLYLDSIREDYRQTPHDWSLEIHEAKASAVFPLVRHSASGGASEFTLSKPSFGKGQIQSNAEGPPDKLWPTFILGADDLGNDVFTRVLYGTRISLSIGIIAVALYVAVGIFLGGLAGYFGGWVDDLLLFLAQVFMTIPALFLILFLLSITPEPSIFYIMFIIALLNWPYVMRLVRGEFLRQREIDYVAASKALGFSNMRIMFRHIAPNSMAPVFVSATFGVAAAILIESTISFLGLGDPDAPSWGQLLKVGYESETTGRHLTIIAGTAIFLTVLILNLIGEGLRDALDPKLRK